MREPRPDWSPLGVNFKILDEHPYLFYISSPPLGGMTYRLSNIKVKNKTHQCRDPITGHLLSINNFTFLWYTDNWQRVAKFIIQHNVFVLILFSHTIMSKILYESLSNTVDT